MKSNMMASASWPAVKVPACDCSPVTAPISRHGFRLLSKRSVCCQHVRSCSTARRFDLIRHKRHGDDAVLIAFDLIELDGEDLRRTPIEQRKRKLAKLVRYPNAGIVLNEVFEGDGDILFAHACKLGCEGIVSKRLGSPYRSGRSSHWVKLKIRKPPAVKPPAHVR
jgi:bifunctional non-homologous end joining protein LigD